MAEDVIVGDQRAEMRAEIARRLAAAFISYQGFVSYQTAMKRYCDGPVKEYWLALADQVLDDFRSGRILSR